jgi:hypothetical protein
MEDLDKQQEHLSDATDTENLSDCCNAPVINETFCKDCMEHCR